MGIVAQTPDFVEPVAGRLAGPEVRACNIYRIGTAVDGCDADISIPGRSQKFEELHYLSALSIFFASSPNLGSLTAFW